MRESSASDWNSIWKKQQRNWSLVTVGRWFYNSFFLSVLRKSLGESASITELGCGTGSLGFLLSASVRHYVGIDISSQAIDQARSSLQKSHISNISFICADLLSLKISEQFDVVWSQGLLEHFEDEKKVILAHLSFARPGGIVVMSVPMRCSIYYLWFLISWGGRLWPWGEQKFYTRSDLERIIRSLHISIAWRIRTHWLLGLHIVTLSLPDTDQ